MFKTKIKKAHLFTATGQRNRYFIPKVVRKRAQRSVWQQMYTLLF